MCSSFGCWCHYFQSEVSKCPSLHEVVVYICCSVRFFCHNLHFFLDWTTFKIITSIREQLTFRLTSCPELWNKHSFQDSFCQVFWILYIEKSCHWLTKTVFLLTQCTYILISSLFSLLLLVLPAWCWTGNRKKEHLCMLISFLGEKYVTSYHQHDVNYRICLFWFYWGLNSVPHTY